METLEFIECFFGVIGGKNEKYGVELRQIYGTAFPIRDKYFITAGHSIQNALENEYIGITYGERHTPELKASKIIDYEIFEKIDLAIIKVEKIPKHINIFKFNPEPQPMLTDIKTGGYPHALDYFENRITERALKGYIVSYTDHVKDRNIYELSFHCPKGISGAPIYISDDNQEPTILGYIIGNSVTDISVFSEREVLKDKNIEITHEKTETTKFGLAIQIGSIMNLHSRLLNMTIGSYLKNYNLLV